MRFDKKIFETINVICKIIIGFETLNMKVDCTYNIKNLSKILLIITNSI